MPEILETKNCVVAFLDLLGTSAVIMNDEHDSNLYSMNYILQTAFDMCSDKHLCKAEVKVKAFSDNIVFSMELPDDLTEPERLARVQNVLEICAYFQIAAFGRGIATRGGITIGTMTSLYGVKPYYGHTRWKTRSPYIPGLLWMRTCWSFYRRGTIKAINNMWRRMQMVRCSWTIFRISLCPVETSTLNALWMTFPIF